MQSFQFSAQILAFPPTTPYCGGSVWETNPGLTGADCATTQVSHAASRGIYHHPEKMKVVRLHLYMSTLVCF